MKPMAKLKAQVSVEWISFTAFSLLVFLVATAISIGYWRDVQNQHVSLAGVSLCQRLAQEANTAASFGTGYERSFDLPYDRIAYPVEFNNPERRLYVTWGAGSCSRPLLANVSGPVIDGMNFIRVVNTTVVLN